MVIIRTTVREQVYHLIKDRILRGEYTQGEALNIGHLSKALDSSNTPVREALSRLESEGLVTSAANAKYRVVSFTEKSFSDLNYSLLVLSRAAVELYRTPSHLLALAALLEERLAAQEQLFDSEDSYAYDYVTLQFDRAIVEAAGNDILLEVFDKLNNLFLLSIAWVHQKEKQKGLLEHRAILDAVRNHDTATVLRILDRHYNKHL